MTWPALFRRDAAQTIAAFSARLRDQVDLDTLTGELLAMSDLSTQRRHRGVSR